MKRLKLNNDELEFTLDETDFDLDETKWNLDNEKIIEQRWKNTDKYIKDAEPEIQKIYNETLDAILEATAISGATAQNLNEKPPESLKRAFNKKVKEWDDKGYVKGYFDYFIKTMKYTYGNILKALLYAAYAEANIKAEKECNKVFKKVAHDMLKQARRDRKETKKKDDWITWALIAILLFNPKLNLTFSEYLEALMMTNTDEAMSAILTALEQNREVNEQTLIELLNKQRKRIVNVSEDKESGALVDTARSLGNQVYVKANEETEEAAEAGRAEKVLVRFIAELDDRTTKMCQSLDGQLFDINGENEFTRYSDQAKKYVTIKCNGLVPGVNLPPINDHFHWCRSTIIYEASSENVVDNASELEDKAL